LLQDPASVRRSDPVYLVADYEQVLTCTQEFEEVVRRSSLVGREDYSSSTV
jgi:hypothetical protein